MKKSFLVCLSFLACIEIISAQQTTYYGSKFCLEFNTIGTLPIFARGKYAGSFYQRESKNSTQLVAKRDFLNYGFNGSITFLSNGKVSLGLASSVSFITTPGPNAMYLPGDEKIYINHEQYNLRSFTFMPVLNIHGRNIIKPAGITHEIGIGPAITKIREKEYIYTLKSDSYYDKNDIYHSTGAKEYVDSLETSGYSFFNTSKTYLRTCLLYGIKMRVPLSKNLLLNYGLRYTLNLGQRKSGSYYYNSFEKNISVAQFYSFISFGIGLTATF